MSRDAGVVHDAVELAVGVGRHLDDLAGRNGFRHRLEIGDRGAAALLDFLDHLFGWRGAGSRAVGGDAGIVDNDLGALTGAEQRDLAANAATRAGDDDDFVLQRFGH